MTLPAFIFGSLIGAFLGAAFHLFRGGSWIRLVLYLALGISGFWAGHWFAANNGWTFLSLGLLRLGFAIAGSVIFLGAGYWLSLVQIQDTSVKK